MQEDLTELTQHIKKENMKRMQKNIELQKKITEMENDILNPEHQKEIAKMIE